MTNETLARVASAVARLAAEHGADQGFYLVEINHEMVGPALPVRQLGTVFRWDIDRINRELARHELRCWYCPPGKSVQARVMVELGASMIVSAESVQYLTPGQAEARAASVTPRTVLGKKAFARQAGAR